MSDRDSDDAPAGPTPAIPGLTRNEDRVIRGDAPDEAAAEEDDGDPMAPFDAENGPLGVKDDDVIGADADDDAERERGATEA